MALFKRRNRDNGVLPEEVRDYYQAESRQRTGAAWFLAAATLILTILIAVVLFIGGRWIYRHVFHRTNTPTATVQTVQDKTNTSTNENPKTSSTNTSQTPSTSTSTATTPKPTTTPNTGPSELINTGPGDEL